MISTFRTNIKYTPESSQIIGELASIQRQAYNMGIDFMLAHPNKSKFDLQKAWTEIRANDVTISQHPVMIQRPGLVRAYDAVKKFHAAQSKYVDYKKEPRINPDTKRLYRSRKHNKSILIIHDSNAIKMINTNKFQLPGSYQIIETSKVIPSDAVIKTINIIERTKYPKHNMKLRDKTYVAFVSIERPDPEPIEPTSDITGYDLGSVQAVTTSDGEHYNNPNADKISNIQERINSINANLDTCKHGSVTWRKLRRKKRSLHREHNILCSMFELATAKSIAQKGTAIAADGVLPRNMMASAAGTIENPGKNVAQKRGLNRSLSLARFGKLRDKIDWECKKIGKLHMRVPAKNGSITCHDCGHVDKKSRKSQAEFECTACYFSANADHNAAMVHADRLYDILFSVDSMASGPAPGKASLNRRHESNSAQMAFNLVWSG